MAEIRLRPARPEDVDFLYELNRETLRDYVVRTWGVWDEEWQRGYLLRHFDPTASQVIVVAGQDVGVLRVEDQGEEIFLSVIEVSPAHQRQGIGTSVIAWVLDDAHRRGLPVGLQVLKVSPARRLYERLGFVVVGETATHYLMRASPPCLSGSG